METAHQIGEKGIVMYMVGCEPSINPYRDWFMAVAHITNGQYVPLANSTFLAQVITGGAQEELALQRLLEEVNQEVQQEARVQGGGERIDEEALTHKVHAKLKSKGAFSVSLSQETETQCRSNQTIHSLLTSIRCCVAELVPWCCAVTI